MKDVCPIDTHTVTSHKISVSHKLVFQRPPSHATKPQKCGSSCSASPGQHSVVRRQRTLRRLRALQTRCGWRPTSRCTWGPWGGSTGCATTCLASARNAHWDPHAGMCAAAHTESRQFRSTWPPVYFAAPGGTWSVTYLVIATESQILPPPWLILSTKASMWCRLCTNRSTSPSSSLAQTRW
jgi:hypothetical protein